MSSITSKPLKEFKFAAADFSPVKLEVSSRRTDASHPYEVHNNQSVKTQCVMHGNLYQLAGYILFLDQVQFLHDKYLSFSIYDSKIDDMRKKIMY